MIENVTARINGLYDIELTLNSNGTWGMDNIPPPQDGSYILSITATDTAGNVAYNTYYRLTYDPATLEIKLLPIDFEIALQTIKDARNDNNTN